MPGFRLNAPFRKNSGARRATWQRRAGPASASVAVVRSLDGMGPSPRRDSARLLKKKP